MLDVESLPTLAVYFVPAADSALYKFGTTILGYDCRRGEAASSAWGPLIGPARQFGIHVTLCDVLYFENITKRTDAISEVRSVAAEFEPFLIGIPQVLANFPAPGAISIAVEDHSGAFEAIHSELVHRVNRRAFGSNYSLGLAPCDRQLNAARSELMIRRYHAPYVLSGFQPHLTLLGAVPLDTVATVHRSLVDLFTREIVDRQLIVTGISVMAPKRNSVAWIIGEECGLKSTTVSVGP